MTKFHACYSTVNDTGWWGASSTCARPTLIDAFLVKESALLNLNIAISTILAQGSAIKQCRPLVQNRSDFELGLCFSIGRSNERRFPLVGR